MSSADNLANSWDQDQNQLKVIPGLHPKCLTSNKVPERIFAKDIKSIQLVKKDLFVLMVSRPQNMNVGMTGFVHLN